MTEIILIVFSVLLLLFIIADIIFRILDTKYQREVELYTVDMLVQHIYESINKEND